MFKRRLAVRVPRPALRKPMCLEKIGVRGKEGAVNMIQKDDKKFSNN